MPNKKIIPVLFLAHGVFLVSACGEATPVATATPSESPTGTATQTLTPVPSPTPEPQFYQIQGIPSDVVIAESSLEVQWDTHGADIPPGEYLIYHTNQQGDYAVWLRSLERDEQLLFTCNQCPSPITYLDGIYPTEDRWLISSNSYDPYTSTGVVVVFDAFHQTAQRIAYSSSDLASSVQALQVSEFGILFSHFNESNKRIFFFGTMAGDWETFSGTLLYSAETIHMSLYSYQGDNGVLTRISAELKSPQNELYFYSLTNNVLYDWSGLLSGAEGELVDFLGSSPGQEWIVLGISAPQQEDFQTPSPCTALMICPYDVLRTQSLLSCTTIADLQAIFPPIWVGSIYPVDDTRLLLVRPGGIAQNMQIGTLDLRGNLRMVYVGAPLTLAGVSPDGHWMLFENNSAYGLLNLQDGSTSYLGLPENASFVTWLTIP